MHVELTMQGVLAMNGVHVGSIKKFGENLNQVRATSGDINLRVTREGLPSEELKTGWFNFYIESWRTVVEAYFGEETGEKVPALMLLANRKLEQKTYEIKIPSTMIGRLAPCLVPEGRMGELRGMHLVKVYLKFIVSLMMRKGSELKGLFRLIM